MATGHGGNLRELAPGPAGIAEQILDFSASINPLGPPECLRAVLSRSRRPAGPLPRSRSRRSWSTPLAAHYRVPAEQIVVGNGSTEILFALARACDFDRAVIPVPSYTDYAAAVAAAGRAVDAAAAGRADGLRPGLERPGGRTPRRGDLVLLGQPNNPTGLAVRRRAIPRRLPRGIPATTFVVDEAFADFVEAIVSLAATTGRTTSIVVRSLTKFYAIPGLRLGYAVARADVAARIREQIPPWSVNTLAQAAGVAVLADEEYARRTVAYVGQQRRQLAERAAPSCPGCTSIPATANFLLVRLDRGRCSTAAELGRAAAGRRASPSARSTPREHLDGRFFRVAVRTAAENERLLRGAGRVLRTFAMHFRHAQRRGRVRGRSPTSRDAHTRSRSARRPALMIQGTSSNAGKSVLTAALCRILLQDGVRVAPFKAQNMSLNSFVTRDGGEMGRAQVVQAQACRLEPDVRMNPVLLKPNSDTGSQVIVRGQPVGNMHVGEYVALQAAGVGRRRASATTRWPPSSTRSCWKGPARPAR